jgi:ATP-dependent RNA helicase DeaD
MKNLRFQELNLSKEVQKAVAEMGFEEATPIQSQSIPHLLSGKDLIGQAQTGTGKTCAFGIPVIEMVRPEVKDIQGLILCPTRELAIQTAEELKNVAKFKRGIRILPVYGGQPIERQIAALKTHPQIIIGTPGRTLDHLRRRTLKFGNLKMMVLDEADEMLNMGFRDDIDTILKEAPREKQTVLYSATMPKEIMDLTVKYQNKPVLIKATHQQLTVPKIEQYYIETRHSSKLEILTRMIDTYNFKLTLVFCNTKRLVDELASNLQSRGYLVEALHGDIRQTQRDKVMAKFRQGKVDILIATDVAARGIDVDDIDAVFNYDIPNDEEYYVHRIGRTGRAGRTGKAYTFVSGREIYRLKEIQRYTKSVISLQKPPSLMDIEDKKANQVLETVKSVLTQGNLSKYIDYIEKMLEDLNPDITALDIAAAFLKNAIDQKSVSLQKLSSPKNALVRQRTGHSKRAHFEKTSQKKYPERKSNVS